MSAGIPIVLGLLALFSCMATSLTRAAAYDAIVTNGDAGGNGDYALGQGNMMAEAQEVAMTNCRGGGGA